MILIKKKYSTINIALTVFVQPAEAFCNFVQRAGNTGQLDRLSNTLFVYNSLI